MTATPPRPAHRAGEADGPDGLVGTAGAAGTDADLLARHVAGDPEAFGTLVARHRDRLWAVALRTTGDPDDAADALQDALVRAFRRAETFRGDAAVTTWLHRVVVNACLDQLRRHKARRTEPVELLDDAPATDPSGTTSTGEPEAVLLERERHDQVGAALASLPPEQRAALVLIDMQGFSVLEAARMLDCAEGTVKSRCSRGRARLAPMLADLSPRQAVDPAGNPAAAARVPSTPAVDPSGPAPRHRAPDNAQPGTGRTP